MAKVDDALKERIKPWVPDMAKHKDEYVAVHTYIGLISHGAELDNVKKLAGAAVASVDQVSIWKVSLGENERPTFACQEAQLGPDPIEARVSA